MHTVRESEDEESVLAGFSSEQELFAALDAGYVPPHIASRLGAGTESENGFDFSNQANVSELDEDTDIAA